MVIVADKNMTTDGSAYNMLAQVKTDLPIVLVSRPDGFVFNTALLTLKDYVLCDFVEYGHEFEFGKHTHIFGVNTNDYSSHFEGEEWQKFDDWVTANPPKLYLKRELLQSDASELVQPIEYAGLFHTSDVATRTEFNARPLGVFYAWGYSSEQRRQLHGDIWKKAKDYGYMVADNLFYLNAFLQGEPNPKKWMTAHIAHYSRHPMQDILNVQALAKISVSLPGAGVKCFRSAEAPLNAVMAMYEDNYAWTFPWVDGENCLKIEKRKEVSNLAYVLEHGELHDVYLRGISTARKYYLPNYIKHLEDLIKEKV